MRIFRIHSVRFLRRNQAIRELVREGIRKCKGKPLDMCRIEDILNLYKTVFGREAKTKQERKSEEEKMGKIYLIGSREECRCKIGFSKNPKKRIKGIQTGCPSNF